MPSKLPVPVRICVIGGGHVGLPLAVELAASKTPTEVIVCDLSANIVSNINSKKAPFDEPGLQKSLSDLSGNLRAENSILPAQARTIDYYIICVNTYVEQHFKVSWSQVKMCATMIAESAPNSFVVVRSTVPPVAIQSLAAIVGQNNIAFCPERIAEGNALKELHSLNQIIGVFNEDAELKSQQLFGILGVHGLHIVSPEEAVIAKLLTNSYRYAHFAIANYFAQICENYGVDYGKLYPIMTADYKRNESLPKSGFSGGSCLRKDWAMLAGPGIDMSLLLNAYYINEKHVDFIFGLVESGLEINYGHVAQVGNGFKPGSTSIRDSLAQDLLTKMRTVFPQDIDVFVVTNTFPKTANFSVVVICDTTVDIEPHLLAGKIIIDVYQKFGKGIFIDNTKGDKL